MNLLELAAHGPPSNVRGVPEWTLGCFRRRSITFFNGATDTETEVYWLQSNNLTFDLRLSPARTRWADPRLLARCSAAELAALCEAEGGLAHTHWDGRCMQWNAWTSFQTHAKWPEPGVLQRVGDCLIEFAPSGAYVEDWRLQATGSGPLVGLELVEEVDVASGTVLHRGGGLVVCGTHAGFVRGRPAALAEAPLLAHLPVTSGDGDTLSLLFACEASYARYEPASHSYQVEASTTPWREGKSLLSLDGFEYDLEKRQVVQRAREGDRELERRFRVDTLETAFAPDPSTRASPAAHAWLRGEADTLLRTARRPR
jgi:hypothetical protein